MVSLKICSFLVCIIGVLSQSDTLEDAKRKQMNDLEVRRAMRTCIFENKVTYTLAIQYGKGDFSDSSEKGKCFLKCFAVKLNLFDPESGNPRKDELLSYASYLSSANLNFVEIIETCDRNTPRNENQCEFVFEMYKCLWDGIKNSPEPESVRASFNDVFGFNQLFDEAEIKAEQEETKEKVEEAPKATLEEAKPSEILE